MDASVEEIEELALVQVPPATMELVNLVQSIVQNASALPCGSTENAPPRWEVVCATVDLLGNLLKHGDTKMYPQLCQWLWDGRPIITGSGGDNDEDAGKGASQGAEVNNFSFQGLSFFLSFGDSSVQKQLGE
jgi:hypothetical protein